MKIYNDTEDDRTSAEQSKEGQNEQVLLHKVTDNMLLGKV
jgi:hypothetical protein